MVEIKVPSVGESITEVTIDSWSKKEGEAIERDKTVAVLESEKATVELPAEASGTLTKILKKSGDIAQVGETIAIIDTDAKPTVSATQPAPPPKEQKTAEPAKPKAATPVPPKLPAPAKAAPPKADAAVTPPPAEQPKAEPVKETKAATEEAIAPQAAAAPVEAGHDEEIVPMTRLRRTIARRLVEVQQTAAMLTTFNEIDMSGVIALRKEHGEAFQQKYNVKLGFMSFFVKAAVDALKLVPEVNAEVRGDDIVYKNHYDIALAIGGGKGLVVPVLRNAERLSFAEVEVAIGDFARRAKDNKLKPEELQGGTFTITNGGIYGSMLSTPILNPPQSGILGMHNIQERPVAREGQVVIRPMMYVALTYDHRLVDGREAVTFLKRIKEAIEAPARMLIEI
ncbi:MAG TPA: 2-oxoglutarate dehydrogenase complex dihydrolipoyllysine-residue succinyltransferase [Candidatus Limnocylindria bacterium]|nr:2-oxoglutarate dehydrogenase complex dihydrolipoyllysine-residue succinyltransferase [Candidatus Limnocylindria bacterium]